MRPARVFAGLVLLLCSTFALARDKKKIILPDDVLQARTVLVVVDPEAGMAIDAPNANQTARDDVEKALMKWGRFELVTETSTADLVITVRKGSGKMVQPTIGGIPQNNRPVIFEPGDSGGRIGGSRGTPPTPGDPTASQYPSPSPQVEGGAPDDTLIIYRGKREDPLGSPWVWRYSAKGGLRSPTVPAVEEFKKTITEAEKQKANTP